MKKFLIPAAAVVIMTSAAYAQTEFYVVQDISTKKCTIVDEKPTTTTTGVVGDGKAFKTRTAAETGMKTIKVCAH
jgi:hypothetical protein